MNREFLQSFTEGKPLSITPYGRTMAISALPAAGAFSRGWNLVRGAENEYTLVYQFETVLMSEEVDYIRRQGETDSVVRMSFGEIDGMWSNKNKRLRIFCKFEARNQDVFNLTMVRYFDLISGAIRRLWEYHVLRTTYRHIPQPDRFCEDNRNRFMEMVRGTEFIEDMPLFEEDGKTRDLPCPPSWHEEKKTGGFADVAGLDELKKQLLDEVIWPLKNKAKAAMYRITPPSGMLLYGPPGCGKTFFAQKLAEQTGFSFKMVSPSDIGGMIIHETQKKVAELFDEARNMAPCIICFDEIDAMIPRRTSTPGLEYQNTEVNEFLAQMNNCGEKGVFMIGTTNSIDLIDPAALRTGRLDYHVEIPVPGQEQRAQLFKVCLQNRPLDADIDYETLAILSEGLVASDIAFVVNKAALAAARSEVPISHKILVDTLAENKHAITRFCQMPMDVEDEIDMDESHVLPPMKKVVS